MSKIKAEPDELLMANLVEIVRAILITEILYRQKNKVIVPKEISYEFNNLRAVRNKFRFKIKDSGEFVKKKVCSIRAMSAANELSELPQPRKGLHKKNVIVISANITAEDINRTEYILKAKLDYSSFFGVYKIVYKVGTNLPRQINLQAKSSDHAKQKLLNMLGPNYKEDTNLKISLIEVVQLYD